MARPKAIVPVATDDNFVNVMLFSEPGAGKSVFAGTSEKALILASNANETTPMAIHGSKAEKWVMEDHNDLLEAHEYLRHGGTQEFEWVWLDNGTLMQEQGLDQIMADVAAAKSNRSIYRPDRPEYGENQNRMGLWVRWMVALPINFGITAHVMTVEDPAGNQLKMPLFQGGGDKFAQKLCGYMGMVGYMTVAHRKEDDVRKIILTKRAGIMAKNRFHCLGKEWYVKTGKNGLIDPTTGIPGWMKEISKVLPNLGKHDAPVVNLEQRRRRPVKKAAGRVRSTTARKAT